MLQLSEEPFPFLKQDSRLGSGEKKKKNTKKYIKKKNHKKGSGGTREPTQHILATTSEDGHLVIPPTQ